MPLFSKIWYSNSEVRETKNTYKTLYRGGTGEIEEKKSRFIADIRPAESEEEARSFVEEISKKYWDARHHCYAYIIGEGAEIARASDDGEPSRTAGIPMLDVLRGEELCYAAAVVTRYFGGTLLGTGGLVRAYSEAVRAGLANAEIITKVHGKHILLSADYSDLGGALRILEARNIKVQNTEYAERVLVDAAAPFADFEKLGADITERSGGRIAIQEGAECWLAETSEGIRIFDH